MTKNGLLIGIGYGLAQDAVGAMRGRTPGYFDWIRRKMRRKADMEEEVRIA
jgi:hypothetical protein